jgi:DNA-binding NtrC family response regulator
MPPLRDIREEIPLLASHFLREYCRESGRSLEFSPAVLRSLNASLWPGNIRQLRNEVLRLAACAAGAVIDEDDLFEGLPAARPTGLGAVVVPIQAPAKAARPQSLKVAIEELEREMIAEALQSTKNNQQQAARILGLSRQGLINKMKRFGFGG